MTSLQRPRPTDLTSPFGRLDRLFEEWFRTMPARRPPSGDGPAEPETDGVLRVDEFRDGATHVIRAEMPGIDPDRDVELTIADGMLRIRAERRVEEEHSDRGWTRRELRYGSFSRTLPLPADASEKDVTASYKDGILEIRVPVVEPPAAAEPTRIRVEKS